MSANKLRRGRGDYLELDDRKEKILKAIINNYMETGEPVGSRTISKLPGLGLSSATIRNEMSDLEDMGYILQPYTSAGRIPSDKGYRFYVDEILKDKELEISGFRTEMLDRVDKLENVLKQLAKIIALNTNYATLISGPLTHKMKIKFIQISKIEDTKILAVIVFDGNIIKNNIIDIERVLEEDELLNLNLLINTSINGLSVDEINLNIMSELKEKAGNLRDVVDVVLTEIAKAYKDVASNMQIYTSGTTNIFKYPELTGGDKASKLIDTIEEKDKLKKIFEETIEPEDDKHAVQVYIGEELPIQNMQDCSVLTAVYEIGNGIRGTIGIVGPKRMDYEKVLRTIKSVMKDLNDSINDK
jgi:hypothetical protein